MNEQGSYNSQLRYNVCTNRNETLNITPNRKIPTDPGLFGKRFRAKLAMTTPSYVTGSLYTHAALPEDTRSVHATARRDACVIPYMVICRMEGGRWSSLAYAGVDGLSHVQCELTSLTGLECAYDT